MREYQPKRYRGGYGTIQ
jgi:hypothetical protein